MRLLILSFSGHEQSRIRNRLVIGLVAAFLIISGWLVVTPSSYSAEDEIVIVALGDSLTAGLFLPQKQAFPFQLEMSLKEKGYKVKVLNAGVSGDTASSALVRVDWSVPENADAVIIELGANDALRGLDPKLTRDGLEKIITRLKQRKLKVLLTGMEAPRGNGPKYVKAFSKMYSDLAEKYDILLYPFFLEGVALNNKYNLPDGLHPNPKGVQVIVKKILPSVEKLIEQVKAVKQAKKD